jgi:hypothetical protein
MVVPPDELFGSLSTLAEFLASELPAKRNNNHHLHFFGDRAKKTN